MSKDQYIKWEPIENIPTRLYCEALHDDYEGFRIILRGEAKDSRTLRITFDLPLAYRNMDEGSLLKSLKNIKTPGDSSLYFVNDSSWIEWFHQESCGIYKGKNIIHYAIITPNDCIDVLSEYAPNVEWLN
jgi:hypothetical protein